MLKNTCDSLSLWNLSRCIKLCRRWIYSEQNVKKKQNKKNNNKKNDVILRVENNWIWAGLLSEWCSDSYPNIRKKKKKTLKRKTCWCENFLGKKNKILWQNNNIKLLNLQLFNCSVMSLLLSVLNFTLVPELLQGCFTPNKIHFVSGLAGIQNVVVRGHHMQWDTKGPITCEY